MSYNCTADPFVVSVQPDYAPGRFIINKFILSFMLIFATLGAITFIYFARRYERLRVRSVLVVLTSTAGVYAVALNGPLGFSIGWLNFPCWAQLITNIFVVPLLGIPIILQLSLFLYLTTFQMIARMQRNNLERFDVDVNPSIIQSLISAIKSLKWLVRDASSVQQGDTIELLRAMRFLLSSSGLVTLLLLLEFPVFIMFLVLLFYRPAYIRCTACLTSDEENDIIIVQSVVILTLGIALAIRTRHFPDRWQLARESTIVCCFALLAFIGFVLSAFAGDNSAWDWIFVVGMAVCCMLGTQTFLQVHLAMKSANHRSSKTSPQMAQSRNVPSTHHHHHHESKDSTTEESREVVLLAEQDQDTQTGQPSSQTGSIAIQVLQKSMVPNLYKILQNKASTERFTEHLTQELGIENLYVLEAVAEWKFAYSSLDAKTRDVRARKLFKAYVGSDSLYAVNISSAQHDSIKSHVQDLNTNVPFEVFDNLVMEISNLLERGAVNRYRARQQQGVIVSAVV